MADDRNIWWSKHLFSLVPHTHTHTFSSSMVSGNEFFSCLWIFTMQTASPADWFPLIQDEPILRDPPGASHNGSDILLHWHRKLVMNYIWKLWNRPPKLRNVNSSIILCSRFLIPSVTFHGIFCILFIHFSSYGAHNWKHFLLSLPVCWVKWFQTMQLLHQKTNRHLTNSLPYPVCGLRRHSYTLAQKKIICYIMNRLWRKHSMFSWCIHYICFLKTTIY